jgi:hypothetical protein
VKFTFTAHPKIILHQKKNHRLIFVETVQIEKELFVQHCGMPLSSLSLAI